MSAPHAEPTEARQLICIGCPLGCHLEVTPLGDGAWKTDGYQCKKGKEYGVQEVIEPKRSVATSVRIHHARWARLPVRTAADVPRERVMDVCRAVHGVEVTAPVAVGQVVLANVAGTGVDVIATRSMEVTR